MKRKKIRYIPGLISLFGLPLLLIFYFPEAKPKFVSLNLFLPSDKKPTPDSQFYSTYVFRKKMKGKKIARIFLDNTVFWTNSSHIDNRLLLVKNEIEHIQVINDTSVVLKIEFGYDSYYHDFVWVLNQILINRVKRFAFIDNSFYIFANDPIPRYEPTEITFEPVIPILLPGYKEMSDWDIYKEQLYYKLENFYFQLKYNKWFVIGFVVLILIPGIIRLRKRKLLLLKV